MAWTASTGDYTANRRLSYQDVNKMKANSIALASAIIGHYLGGRRTTGVVSSSAGSWTDVPDWQDVVLDGTNLSGLTVRARVQRKTGSTGVSVTARVYNVSNSSAAGTGTAHSSDTNWKEETFTVTLTTAAHTYRLQLAGGTTSGEVFGIGKIELLATS